MSGNGNGTTRALTVQQKTKQLLEDRREEFARALAGRVDPDAFVRVAYSTITKAPKLLEATPASLLMALLEAASLGLVPNSVMGEAYIVPFNNKVKVQGGPDRWEVQAQFIPGFRGLAKLARQSGHISKIVARVVREGDHFELVQGTEEKLIHIPLLDSRERPMQRVYAVAFFRDNTPPQFEVMEKWEVERVRARSKSKDNGPWVSDYDEMAKKTVFRRLAKHLPLSDTDLERALEADNRDFDMSASVRGTGPVDDLNRELAGEPEEDIPEADFETIATGEVEEDDGARLTAMRQAFEAATQTKRPDLLKKAPRAELFRDVVQKDERDCSAADYRKVIEYIESLPGGREPGEEG